MNDAELLAIAKYEVEQSTGYDQDVLSTKREHAMNYYNGIMPSAPEGNSQLVSYDVADTVNSLMSQVGRIFQTSNVMFEALSEEDEAAAKMESDACEWQLNKSDGLSVLHESAHDALLIGNGWIKVTVEDEAEVTTESYPKLDELQLMQVMTPTAENQEVDATVTGDGYDIKRTTTTYEIKVECVDPAIVLFSNARTQFSLDNLRMVGERKLFTASDLREMGVSDNDIHTIPDSDDDYWNAVRAREGIYQDDTSDIRAAQDAEQVKECFDIYLRVDSGSGVSELRHLLYGGNVLIENEPALCIPYATGSPLPMPHRIQGQGMYEQMKGIQDAKTDVLRAYSDNLSAMNTSRLAAVEGEVNMKDLTGFRVNGVVRVKNPNAIVPLPATDSGQQAITGLNYLDTVRSQRGGASNDLNDADRQLMQSSAVAAAGAQESAERMAGYYARNLVQTLLKNTYRLIHKKLRLEYPGTIGAKLRGRWQEINPSEWRERKYIEVVAGMTSTERAQKIMSLTQVITKQEMLLAQGGEGEIVDKSKFYEAMDDWLRANELGDASEFFIDPSSEPAQQARQAKSQAQNQQHQQAMQLQQAMISLTEKIERDKIDMERYTHDTELRFKYYDARLDAEIDEAKMTVDSVVKLKAADKPKEKTA